MRSRYLPEFNMNDSIETVFEESEELIHIETDDNKDVVVMSYEHYFNLLSKIVHTDEDLKNKVLLEIGNQIVGWEDVTADLHQVAHNLSIEIELVHQVLFQNEEFYDTDGDSRVSISPLAWEDYLKLKDRY